MPIIPAMTLSGTSVHAGRIYSEGLFNPVNPPTSLEILHGGLASDNYAGGTSSIPAYACAPGSFVRGFYHGFERWEFTYASQLGNDPESRVVHSGLTTRLFLPWDASFVLFGFQALFRQDATVWDTDGLDDAGLATPDKREFWDWRVMFNGSPVSGLAGRLPPGRWSDDSPDTVPFTMDPGYHSENRWRSVARTAMILDVPKGHRSVSLSLWAGIIGPDQKQSKVVTPSGGLWIFAAR